MSKKFRWLKNTLLCIRQTDVLIWSWHYANEVKARVYRKHGENERIGL